MSKVYERDQQNNQEITLANNYIKLGIKDRSAKSLLLDSLFLLLLQHKFGLSSDFIHKSFQGFFQVSSRETFVTFHLSNLFCHELKRRCGKWNFHYLYLVFLAFL